MSIPPPPAKRGPHAERKAATRTRVFEASTFLLCERGYGEVSTSLIARHAGLSRGAIQKQFATKEALVVGLIEYLGDRLDQRRQERLSTLEDPVSQWVAVAEQAWEDSRSPYAIAFLEIQMATRRHPLLAAQIRPRAIHLKKARLERIYALAAQIGMTDMTAVRDIVLYDLATINGLAIDALFWGETADAEVAMDRLRETCRRRVTQYLASAEAGKK